MDTLVEVTTDPISRYLSQRGAKFDRKNRLRIMNTSEVLDTALRIYQRFGLTFLRLTVAPALLCLASIGFVQNYVLPGLFTTKAGGTPGQLIADVAGALATAVFVGGPLFLLGLSYSSSLVVHLVSDYMIGKTPDPEAAAETARAVLPRLFLVNLKELCLSVSGIVVSTAVMALGGYLTSVTVDTDVVSGLVTFLGVLGFCAGGIIFLYIVACDALAAPVAVLEGVGPRMASKRSRELLKKYGYHPSGTGTIWSVYGLLGFVSLVLGGGIFACSEALGLGQHLASFLAFLPGAQVFIRAFDLLPSFFVIWTLMPVWASVITIVYYERKIRLEGYDIDVLASEIAKSNRAIGFEQ